jgi:hypothetical protein
MLVVVSLYPVTIHASVRVVTCSTGAIVEPQLTIQSLDYTATFLRAFHFHHPDHVTQNCRSNGDLVSR